ncbi:MAG: hypothetical protein K6U14_10855 [Firmicutes bacterium]|nr:hypothetical protein [Alicyclobacillaceae bacterium]MCL6498111.1 hypothetical protein [Bacillota bacterium]
MARIDQRFVRVPQPFERLDHRFDALKAHLRGRFEALEPEMHGRCQAMEQRLGFRVNGWVPVVIATLTAILRALEAHMRSGIAAGHRPTQWSSLPAVVYHI